MLRTVEIIYIYIYNLVVLVNLVIFLCLTVMLT